MKLTVFPSANGDCLLLTSKDGRHVLIDGGMPSSYRRYVGPRLETMARDGHSLDAVYVSHTDDDHITGILELTEDAYHWKIFDAHLDGVPDDGESDAGDGFLRPRDRSRPPAIDRFWYNAFAAVVPEESGAIEAALIQTATALAAASGSAELRAAALANRELVASIRSGIKLSHRLQNPHLGYRVNPEFGGELMQIDPDHPQAPEPLAVGSMRFHLIGPFKEDLDTFAQEWREWVAANEAAIRDIEEEWERDERDLTPSEFERLQRTLVARATGLGRRGKVSAPNLASLMFLVEEAGRTILLTGDGHGQDILRGLEQQGRLHDDGGIHVDVLKVQHHGSEHNLDEEFCRRVTANHYVFCGNGAHHNPDLRVLEAIVDSRIGPSHHRSPNPRAKNQFRFWFNNSSTFDDEINADNKGHMAQIEDDVKTYIAQSGEKMYASFITDPRWEKKQRLDVSVGG